VKSEVVRANLGGLLELPRQGAARPTRRSRRAGLSGRIIQSSAFCLAETINHDRRDLGPAEVSRQGGDRPLAGESLLSRDRNEGRYR